MGRLLRVLNQKQQSPPDFLNLCLVNPYKKTLCYPHHKSRHLYFPNLAITGKKHYPRLVSYEDIHHVCPILLMSTMDVTFFMLTGR